MFNNIEIKNWRNDPAIAAIARVIQDETARAATSDRRTAVEDVAFALANLFASDNPLFDKDRFCRACVPGANVKSRKAA